MKRSQIATFLEKLKDICLSNSSQVETRYLDNTSGLKIPNVKYFKVYVKDLDPLFKEFDLNKKNPPEFEGRKLRNGKYNVYAHRQLKRLEKFRTNPRKFFGICFFLISRSMVFRVMAINKVFPNGYKEKPFDFIMSVNRKMNKLIKTESSDLIFRRVYIPKKDDKFRPLGVPTPEGRLLLSMVNNFLIFFLYPFMDPHQHGFIPGRGTKTAGEDIVSNVLDAQYIYEYDLEKYFENVSLPYISDGLLEKGVPKALVYGLENVNRCTPELTKEDKVDESHVRLSAKDKSDIRNGIFDPNSRMYDVFKEVDVTPYMIEDGYDNIFEYFQAQGAALDYYKSQTVPNQFRGVPQGTNTGPTLSLIPLLNFNTHVNSVKYADDGLLYSNEEFDIYDDQEAGAIINNSKSRGVKFAGKGKRPLKFLGLKYDGSVFTADTRKGSKLNYSLKHSDFQQIYGHRIKKTTYPASFEDIVKSELYGYIQSRLYIGSGNLEDFHQDFILKSGKLGERSGASSHGQGHFNIYNCSSYASESLIKILSNRGRSSKRYLLF